MIWLAGLVAPLCVIVAAIVAAVVSGAVLVEIVPVVETNRRIDHRIFAEGLQNEQCVREADALHFCAT